MSAERLPGPAALDARVLEVLDAHWRPHGFTVPNADAYPHQWLWDSCFHSIIWAHLGRPDRALTELGNVFAHQGPDGFVPHITYWVDPVHHEELWGRQRTSTLTQPPMYGHAVAELVRRGIDVPDDLVAAARRGLEHLAARPRPSGLVPIYHPWESGCDDSPRWDAWVDTPWTAEGWFDAKGALVGSLEFPTGDDGEPLPGTGPVANPAFHPGSAMMTALVAFNQAELDQAVGDTSVQALDRAAGLGTQLAPWWDPTTATWLDAPGGAPAGRRPSGGVRTLEALLGLLAPTLVERPDQVDAAFAQLTDPDAFGARHGPAQVHRGEPTYDPDRYWRGPAWPQLTYLLWVAARRHGRADVARELAESLVRGASRSGLAEHWHPDTGEGQGAAPQSWTGLAAVVWAAEVGDRPGGGG